MNLWIIAAIILVIVYYFKVWRINKCYRLIYAYVEKEGGNLIEITKLGSSGEVFMVDYEARNKVMQRTVRFTIKYKQYWY